MSDTSDTYDGWGGRLTYLLAEGQILALGVFFSLGMGLWLWQPSLPSVPPVTQGILAALLLFGPPLFGIFVTGVRKLRQKRMVTVHHINGVTDVREKYYVEPSVWQEKQVDGPSPFTVNDGAAFEVREFEHQTDIGQLVVRGCYFSQLSDSKLITIKAMLEDIHGDLVEEFLASNRMRGRISKMGLQIQKDVVNEEVEADERGLMNPRTAVKSRFESAREDAENNATENIQDVSRYVEEYADGHGIDTTGGPPATQEQAAQAATDGGERHG
ncbi:hypothetical protein [Halostagnicola kamekurae]|uniref:Uncharacterized protein n=1 Tax=Halostagnicola kamekurae TaxID=619731 RepID=A0A1I6PNU1_9EURY|nr:hypothetical protein [Halostagnicola kamekurae]SFS41893.1 hypothetical protein SAMN04488556_0691 [Halostagnicola kamekurae]